MSEKNKAVVTRSFEELWNKENYDVLEETHHADYVAHLPSGPGDINGVKDFQQFIAMYHAAFPDTHITIEEQIAEGDSVATRWQASGTHQGDFMGMPATGESRTIKGLSIHHLKDGKITESWDNWDALSIWQALVGSDVLEMSSMSL